MLSHTGGTYLINDIDCIRTAHSPMPRRSAREKPSTFAEYNHRKWGVAIEQPELPLVTVGNNLCACNCRADDQHLSFFEKFGPAYEEGRRMNAEQTRHHTFLIGEFVIVTGFTAEVSAEYNSLLLPEIAWNLAVWDQLAQLERRLGYTFRDKGLLREALTHACYANQVSKEQSEHDSKAMQMGLAGARYERLEWLGDVVLKALSSHHIFHRTNPSTAENHLHRMRGQLISNRHLHNVGERMGLAPLMLRVEGQEVTFKMLADVVEALLGSIYLEGGGGAPSTFRGVHPLRRGGEGGRPERWRPLKFAPAQRAFHDRLRANVAALAARGVVFHEDKVPLAEHVLLHPSVVTTTEGRAAAGAAMQQMQLASMCRDPQVQPPHPQPMPFRWPRQQLQQPSPTISLPARNGGRTRSCGPRWRSSATAAAASRGVRRRRAAAAPRPTARAQRACVVGGRRSLADGAPIRTNGMAGRRSARFDRRRGAVQTLPPRRRGVALAAQTADRPQRRALDRLAAARAHNPVAALARADCHARRRAAAEHGRAVEARPHGEHREAQRAEQVASRRVRGACLRALPRKHRPHRRAVGV